MSGRTYGSKGTSTYRTGPKPSRPKGAKGGGPSKIAGSKVRKGK